MPEPMSDNPTSEPRVNGPRSQLGIYRSWLSSPEHRHHVTVGRADILRDTLDTLRRNLGKKPKHHLLFVAPRGCGKTHLLSLIEDEIQREAELAAGYRVVRFPEEANRVCSFADFLLAICEILRSEGAPWAALYERLVTEEDEAVIVETLTKAIRTQYRETKKVFVLMVENLHQIMEEQMKKPQAIQALRGFLMGDNGCLLVATAPSHFGAHTKPDAPFYDFFDTQILDLLSAEDTVELIRRNLEWDQRSELLERMEELRPQLLAMHTLTGGSPRLTVLLYELICTESVTAVRDQFLLLQDRITPFYQDRLRDLAPQERAVLETIASMRAAPGKPAPRKTPGAIAKLMRMSQPQVSSLLNRLTKDLYLVCQPNPDDKRSSIYTIREGFFDLWLAMNLNRGMARRIPWLSDFFAAYYQQTEARRKKQEAHWQDLKAGTFNPDTTESLSYLSNLGETHEQATQKLSLIPIMRRIGDETGWRLLKTELDGLPLDATGRWLCSRVDEFPGDHLDEIAALIECWQTRREGNLEAFAARLREMGETLNSSTWLKLKVEFLRDHIESVPLSLDRLSIRVSIAFAYIKLYEWVEAKQHSAIALQEAEKLDEGIVLAEVLGMHAIVLQSNNETSAAESYMHRALSIHMKCNHDNPGPVVHSMLNLSSLLMSMKKLDDAERLSREALHLAKQSLDESHTVVADCFTSLARVLTAKRIFKEAEEAYNKALSIYESCGECEDESAADVLQDLAMLLQDLARLHEAEECMRKALIKIDKNGKGRSAAVALYCNNLAQLLHALNRDEEANKILIRAMDILLYASKCSGRVHRFLRGVVVNFEVVLLSQGRTREQVFATLAELGKATDMDLVALLKGIPSSGPNGG